MTKIWTAWIISVLLVILAGFVNLHYFRVFNILPIEFATTAMTIEDCVKDVNPSPLVGYHTLLLNTIVDYVYLVAYTLVILFSIKITLDALELKGNKAIYFLGILPGAMDAIENAFLITTALDHHSTISWVYVLVVRIKWAAAIPFYMLMPILMLYGLIVLFRAKQQS
jgi:hypothetical protein